MWKRLSEKEKTSSVVDSSISTRDFSEKLIIFLKKNLNSQIHIENSKVHL
jgi:hypothetical protein